MFEKKKKESKWTKCGICHVGTSYLVKSSDGRSRCCQCADLFEQQKKQKPRKQKEKDDGC